MGTLYILLLNHDNWRMYTARILLLGTTNNTTKNVTFWKLSLKGSYLGNKLNYKSLYIWMISLLVMVYT